MFNDTIEILESLPENRYKHTLRVVENTKDILNKLNMCNSKISVTDDEIIEMLITVSYLHDIGYADCLNKSNFHAYDGYVYLKSRGYSDLICKLVLHHTYSSLLNTMGNFIDNSIYIENSLTDFSNDEKIYFDILTLADMMSNNKGEFVTIADRISDIGERHGYDSIIYSHINEVRNYLLKSKVVHQYFDIVF